MLVYPKEFRKKTIPVEKNSCFVLMPFKEELDYVYGNLKDLLDKLEIKCSRADEDNIGSIPIINRIITKIISSQYLIVDISYMNPNVFYELGIAHTFKDSRNILIIKQKNDEVPFDIKHIKYFEYDINNLKLFNAQIKKFIDSNKHISTFYESLNICGLLNFIDENKNDYIENLQNALGEAAIITCSNVLSDFMSDITEKDMDSLLKKYINYMNELIKKKDISNLVEVINIFFEILSKSTSFKISKTVISDFLNGSTLLFLNDDILLLEWQTDLAIKIAEKTTNIKDVLNWIIEYFKRTKSATIDLNRYKLEKFLLLNNNKKINNIIINSLENDNCYIREHMSDIIGEKNLKEGFSTLCSCLKKEDNFVTASSMIAAIGKLNDINGIEEINYWINLNQKDIKDTKQYFVLNRALMAISSLDNTPQKEHINAFNKKYGELLKDYFII